MKPLGGEAAWNTSFPFPFMSNQAYCKTCRKPFTVKGDEHGGCPKCGKDLTPRSDGRGAQDDLIALMQRYGLTFGRNAIEWRVCRAKDGGDLIGDMPGVSSGRVRILCTDGLLAWFLLGDDKTILFGHLANFEEDKELRKATKQGGAKPRQSPRQVSYDSVLNFLSSPSA